MSKTIESIRVERVADQYPDLSYLGEYSDTPAAVHIDRQARGDMRRGQFRYFNLGTGDAEYIEADYAKMEEYQDGGWNMLGIRAVAEVLVNGTLHTLRSAGLWGVQSDSDESYLVEIGNEQIDELADTLKEFGFTVAEIKAAGVLNV